MTMGVRIRVTAGVAFALSTLAMPAAAQQPCDATRINALAVKQSPGAIYPDKALAERREGTSWVRYHVDATGRGVRAWICRSSGSEDLDKAAVAWALAATFYAPEAGGANVAADGIYEDTIIFSVERETSRRRVWIDRDLVAAGLRTNPVPSYPTEALYKNHQGLVRFALRAAKNGSIDRIEILGRSGHDSLDEAALLNVFRYRFESLTSEFWFRREFEFKLEDSSPPPPNRPGIQLGTPQ